MRYSELEKIIEGKGFCFKHQKERGGGYYALLEQSTPLGEDWGLEFFYKNIADLINQIIEYSYDYDADEEAAFWIGTKGKNGVVLSSIRDLLDDADWKGKKLKELCDALSEKYKKYNP